MGDGKVVIGILLRWRQLGRRYFWPHLLLGMVAASLGLPASAQNSDLNVSSDSPASSLFIGNAARFDHLIRLQEAARRPNFTVDYWHQHAIRTVIRHLSFTLTPQAQADEPGELPLAAQKLALIDSLHALLTSHAALRVAPQEKYLKPHPAAQTFACIERHVKANGIRAGPFLL
ncbi:secA regulator SecM [Mixta sp. Marseille-Q2057]|nr:secA translation cis-regulator SecM [Mixta mediterraneensis]MBE5251279.1 secA regulator SecM [Mixta mediterraneensis]